MMKHVSILVPKGNVIVDTILGTMNLLRMAQFRESQQKHSPSMEMKIELVAESLDPICYQDYLSITPNKTFRDIEKTDLIIIPGLVGNMKRNVGVNGQLIAWIKEQRIREGSEVASLCRGAFLLAETGLLNGKVCATHWLTHHEFLERYPKIKLAQDKIICEDGGIFSSGGAYSFLNLILYLVERYFGRETAIWCSKVSEIDFNREDQNQFLVFSGQKNHLDAQILQAQEFIEAHYQEKISVKQLAHNAAISPRNFLRRFKKSTHNTPVEYLQRVRVEAAKKKLESSVLNINEIMYQCGYQDERAFRTVFRRLCGLTPAEYRHRYNREMANL